MFEISAWMRQRRACTRGGWWTIRKNVRTSSRAQRKWTGKRESTSSPSRTFRPTVPSSGITGIAARKRLTEITGSTTTKVCQTHYVLLLPLLPPTLLLSTIVLSSETTVKCYFSNLCVVSVVWFTVFSYVFAHFVTGSASCLQKFARRNVILVMW